MKLKFMQEGGAMPMEGAPMPPEGGAPMPVEGGAPAGPNPDQLMGLAQEIMNMLGPEGAMALADMLMQMAQGGGAPMGPEAAPAEAPVMARRGGKLYRIG